MGAISYGAYLCLSIPGGPRGDIGRAAVPALAERLGLRNEFEPRPPHPDSAIAFVRRVAATPGAIEDDDLLRADAVIHVASTRAGTVAEFCSETLRLLGTALKPLVLSGVVRPKNYTGVAMNNFAYAHAVVQQPGQIMPNAFLIPMSKTRDWVKDWMERHTYFLLRYDDAGQIRSEGHALASAAGISCLMRRTYKNLTEPAPAGEYDFLTYFECADADIPTFHEVCGALRDVVQNPEGKFVREGAMWHGRRVATWAELFA